MERMWTEDVMMKYPKQWVVIVNTSREKGNRVFGDVFFVTDDADEAYDKAKSLGDVMGTNMVIEGFDDTRRLGGLGLWRR